MWPYALDYTLILCASIIFDIALTLAMLAFPTRIAAGGLFPLDPDSFVCVSRGLGMERGQAPPIRFRCPPELTVLTFRALQTSSP